MGYWGYRYGVRLRLCCRGVVEQLPISGYAIGDRYAEVFVEYDNELVELMKFADAHRDCIPEFSIEGQSLESPT